MIDPIVANADPTPVTPPAPTPASEGAPFAVLLQGVVPRQEIGPSAPAADDRETSESPIESTVDAVPASIEDHQTGQDVTASPFAPVMIEPPSIGQQISLTVATVPGPDTESVPLAPPDADATVDHVNTTVRRRGVLFPVVSETPSARGSGVVDSPELVRISRDDNAGNALARSGEHPAIAVARSGGEPAFAVARSGRDAVKAVAPVSHSANAIERIENPVQRPIRSPAASIDVREFVQGGERRAGPIEIPTSPGHDAVRVVRGAVAAPLTRATTAAPRARMSAPASGAEARPIEFGSEGATDRSPSEVTARPATIRGPGVEPPVQRVRGSAEPNTRPVEDASSLPPQSREDVDPPPAPRFEAERSGRRDAALVARFDVPASGAAVSGLRSGASNTAGYASTGRAALPEPPVAGLTPPRPGTVVLDVPDVEGRTARVRIAVRGESVRTVITHPDRQVVEGLDRHGAELRSALTQRGFTDPSISVRAPRPVDSAPAIAPAPIAVDTGSPAARTGESADWESARHRDPRGDRDTSQHGRSQERSRRERGKDE